MPTVRYSLQAEADLINIGAYTLRTWGPAQADRYLSQIESLCVRLSGNALLGNACNEIRIGFRRMPLGKHMIYYQPIADGISVFRILHQSMLPELQNMEDELG